MIAKLLSRRSFILANAGVVLLLLAAPVSVLAAQGGSHGPNSTSPGALAGQTGQANSSNNAGPASHSNANSPSPVSSQSNANSNSSGGGQSNLKSSSSGSGGSPSSGKANSPTSTSGSSPGLSNHNITGDSNQGDVWVDGYSAASAPVAAAGPGHEMDPHLGCPLYIILWGSGLADSSGIYTVDGWSPSGSGTGDYGHPGYKQDQAWPHDQAHAGTATWTYNTSAGGTQEISYIPILTSTLVANALANHDQAVNGEGLHFKLQFVQDPQKHKTFWVNCPGLTPPTTTGPAVSVVKTNNAGLTGTYLQTEQALAAHQNVEFRAVITNTSSESESITSVTDSYGSTVGAAQSCDTTAGTDSTNVVGTVLTASGSAGDSVTCYFTIDGYSPAAGPGLTDTVQVNVVDTASKTASAEATSTVTPPSNTPSNQLPGVSVVKTNDAGLTGTYLQTEQALAAHQSVEFRAVITNTSSESESITSVTDSYGATVDAAQSCDTTAGTDSTNVVGTVLTASGSAGDSVTCYFTIDGYSPAAGTGLTDTVQVNVVDTASNTASAEASSVVITPPNNVPSGPYLIVTKSVDHQSTLLGQTLNYTITVTNAGNVSATNVAMTDLMTGTAGFQVNDGSNGTTDSFLGNPTVTVTKHGKGVYTWEYSTLAPEQTATVTYSATILAPGNVSSTINGTLTLVNTVTATSGHGGCTSTTCTATVTTTAPPPSGGSLGVTTTKPSGGVLAASTTTPGTGAHLDLLLTLILVLAGLTLIGFAIATRPHAKPQV
ncbi:MAG: DUF7507 domain-containing protein [Candidatus Dormibacteria bacterium]